MKPPSVCRILALDMSYHTGWAVMDDKGGELALIEYGLIELDDFIEGAQGPYPWDVFYRSRNMAQKIINKIIKVSPDVIVVEQSNLGKQRSAQKGLEFIHALLMNELNQTLHSAYEVEFLDTSEWRRALEMKLSKDQKKANAKLSQAKREAGTKGVALDKKSLGVAGKVTWKHLSVKRAVDRWGLELKIKQNDEADAINMCEAYSILMRSK